MIHTAQLGLQHVRNPRCPFTDYLDPDDFHCYSYFDGNEGYQVFAENDPTYVHWLADIGDVDFGDIVPVATPSLDLPKYIPTIPMGGGKEILLGTHLPIVAVSLGDVISAKLHRFPVSLRERFGISIGTKTVLLAYGKDALIESIWPKREYFYEQIARLGFDLVTGINYSVWHEQPHPERLINIKRSLVTFSEMQKRGIPSIPHMYWSGRRDLERWAEWLNNNPQVGIVATDLQTEKTHKSWEILIDELSSHFAPLLKSQVHFLVTGASLITRQDQLKSIFPNRVTISNKYIAMKSICNQELTFRDGKVKQIYLPNMKTSLFVANLKRYGAEANIL